MEWEIIEKSNKGRTAYDVPPTLFISNTTLRLNKQALISLGVKNGDLVNLFFAKNHQNCLGIQVCQEDEERKNGYKLSSLSTNCQSLYITLGKYGLGKKLKHLAKKSAHLKLVEGTRIFQAEFQDEFVLETRESIIEENMV